MPDAAIDTLYPPAGTEPATDIVATVDVPVTVLGANVTVTPEGTPTDPIVIGPVKLVRVNVTVVVVLVPAAKVLLVGDNVIAILGTASTVIGITTVRFPTPLALAFTVAVYAPAGTVEATATLTDAVVPVADAGVKVPVMPVVALCNVSATASANPPVRVIAIDAVCDVPAVTVSAVGVAASEKSGGATTVTFTGVDRSPIPAPVPVTLTA